jgi:hypothetical protein
MTTLPDRSAMVATLKTSICKIRFVKKDGTIRTMLATLQDSELPPATGTGGTRASNPGVLPVYDMEAQGWRSFRIDSLVSFEPLEE